MKENQADFVQLFVDHDFPLNDLFENNDKLSQLYHEQVNRFTREVFSFISLVE